MKIFMMFATFFNLAWHKKAQKSHKNECESNFEMLKCYFNPFLLEIFFLNVKLKSTFSLFLPVGVLNRFSIYNINLNNELFTLILKIV